MHTNKTWFAGVAAGALLASWCLPATAQTSTTNSDNDAEEQKASLQLDEVVVTARKRTERLKEVPISANVQSGEELAKLGVADLEQMTNYVPNLTIQPSPGTPSMYIRGIGSGPSNLAFEPSVGLFIDGLYMGRGRQSSTEFLDVARVEVLRGPQGALFGKNTSSGAVNITTNVPTSDFEAMLRSTGYFEGDEGYDLTGILSGGLTDKLSGRIAIGYTNRDGWIRNTALGNKQEPQRENVQGRLTLAYEPNTSSEFILRAHLFDYQTDGDFMASFPFGAERTLTRATTPGLDEFDDGNGANVGLTGNFEFGEGYTLTTITGYSNFEYLRQLDSDWSPDPYFRSQFGESFWQASQEVRITSPVNNAFSWIAGAYFHRAESDEIITRSYITFGPFLGTSFRIVDQQTTSASIYGQATYDFSKNWRLTGGLRGTFEKKEGGYDRTNAGVVPGTWLDTDLVGEIEEEAFDPSVQLQYLSGPSMFYVSYAKGSKAGGFVSSSTVVTQDGFVYSDETSSSVEAGAKLDLFDRRAQLNLAVFETEYKNLQVAAWDPIANAAITRNAADATARGVEAELAARINEALTFRGSAAYLDIKYDDFPGANCLYDPNRAPGPCLENIGGTRVPRAPEWSATAAFDLDKPLTDRLNLTGRIAASYRSGIYLDDTLAPASYQSDFTKIDARIGIAGVDEDWEVAFIGRNLTNELTASHALGTPFNATSESYALDKPRVLGVQLTLRR